MVQCVHWQDGNFVCLLLGEEYSEVIIIFLKARCWWEVRLNQNSNSEMTHCLCGNINWSGFRPAVTSFLGKTMLSITSCSRCGEGGKTSSMNPYQDVTQRCYYSYCPCLQQKVVVKRSGNCTCDCWVTGKKNLQHIWWNPFFANMFTIVSEKMITCQCLKLVSIRTASSTWHETLLS